ncbi:DUF4365 domain-containing protein [Pseudarthrobacter sp. NPDC058119]|uniref:DUF4365 domain-containing protein n=1 Tax=Pseudarthrobacter sp. NPDC058119 TaxID=3346348 RepID=UPI0036DB91CE
MRQPDRVQRGDIGETAVELFFKQLGWGPLSTSSQDLGTDLLIQLRTEELVDLGLLLGAQVKTGSSWFEESGTVDGREGWWYRESSMSHADYWSNHHVPHILILQSEDCTTIRVWAVLDQKTIKATGQGFKVFVPADQRLDRSFLRRWIELAEKARESLVLEGSRWSFSVAELPETEWARHALIVPRLVAPHPNKGLSAPINWAEAIATCAEARTDRWDYFAAQFESVPSPTEAASSDDPHWRFAASVHQWITQGTAERLRDFDVKGTSRSLRAARAVCLAAAEIDNHRFDAALEALAAEADDEDVSLDQAWLNVHHARILAETGQPEAALELLDRTNLLMAGLANNVTVSAIRSAVLWSMFELTDRGDSDLSKVVAAMDTAAGWWRNQSVARGLEDAAERNFEAWGRDQSVRFTDSHIAHNELFSAALTARLAGDHSSWRSSLGLLAMVDLSSQRGSGAQIRDGLDALRNAGGDSQLRLALSKIRGEGPLDELAAFMLTIRPQTITRSTWRADLAALNLAGSYCSAEPAQELINFLLLGLETPSLLAGRFAAIDPSHKIVDSLWGMRDHLDNSHAHRIIAFALSLGPESNQLLQYPLSTLLDAVDPQIIAENEAALTAKANDENLPGWLRHIFATHAPTARDVLGQSLIKGDLGALQGIGRIERLTAVEATAVVDKCRTAFAGFKRSHNGIDGHVLDMSRLCASIAIYGPESDAWQVLVEFLCDSDAYSAPKRAACKIIAENPEQLPAEHREHLERALWTMIEDTRPDPSVTLYPEIGGAFQELLLALLHPSHPRRKALEGALLTGSKKARSDAADHYARLPGSEPILLALARDATYEVAERAMFGLAKLVARSDEVDDTYIDALTAFAKADGENGAYRVLSGLEMGVLRENLLGLVAGIQEHPSAGVRLRAKDLIESFRLQHDESRATTEGQGVMSAQC